MILAVMQPYIFPYLGYYQLVNRSDLFVFYDDVNYIKSGYINRNNILSNGRNLRFTVPVEKASSFKLINEHCFSSNVKKILDTLRFSYSKAPYFHEVFPLVEKVILSKNRNVANITSQSIVEVFKYLGVEQKFVFSNSILFDRSLSAQDKLLSMCKIVGADEYCNSIGGRSLYNQSDFNQRNIDLTFMGMDEVTYLQGKNEFVRNLSMIDVLMWNSKSRVISFLEKYSIS